jgi:hypothetical protein
VSPSKAKSAVNRPYIWIPGQGPDATALQRLLALVPQQPEKAPGEAWFIADERRYYHFLLEHPVEKLPAAELEHFFFDVTSALVNCKDAVDEVASWLEWLDYLWPRLLAVDLNSWAERRVGEMLYTVVFRMLTARPEPYEGYRSDVLASLGRLTMRTDLWDNDNQCLLIYFDEWPVCAGMVSASLFLSLALLKPQSIQLWTQSLLAIESPRFRAAVLTWLCVACPLLTEDKSLAEVCAENGPHELQWTNCFLIAKSPWPIERANIDNFMRAVRQDLVFEKLLHWQDSIESDRAAADSLKAARIVERLVDDVLR